MGQRQRDGTKQISMDVEHQDDNPDVTFSLFIVLAQMTLIIDN
jgi:hypothetical protein